MVSRCVCGEGVSVCMVSGYGVCSEGVWEIGYKCVWEGVSVWERMW